MTGGSKELRTFYDLPNVPSNMFFYKGSNGMVGVGTTGPTRNIDVVGTGNISSTFGIGGLVTASAGATVYGANVLFSSAAAYAATSAMFWDFDDARLGLGTITPTVMLDVVGAMAITGAITGSGGIRVNAGDVIFSSSTYSPDTNKFVYDVSEGKLGLGTASPSVALDVVGAGKISTTLAVTGAVTASAGITDVGDISVSSAAVAGGSMRFGGFKANVAEAGAQAMGYLFFNTGDNNALYCSTCTTPADGSYCYMKVGAQ